MGSGSGRSRTPSALAAEARRRLARNADPRVAAASRAYFKGSERVAFYGLKAPLLRAIERDLFAEVRSAWAIREARAFCDALLAAPELEAKGLGLLLLGRFQRTARPDLLASCRSWLARGRAANWATTDALSTLVIAPLLRRFPREVAPLEAWTRHRSLWVRRAAAVALTPLARRGLALDASYRVAAALLPDPNDLIHKASGWLLRECGRTDAGRLERFLLEHGRRIPRTALRYAIEHFPAGERKRLLAATQVEPSRGTRRGQAL